MALTEAIKEAIQLQGLPNDLGVEQEHLWKMCDSMSVIHLANNHTFHAQTKRIDIRYHFIREILKEGNIKVEKVDTKDNLVDILTKVANEIKL